MVTRCGGVLLLGVVLLAALLGGCRELTSAGHARDVSGLHAGELVIFVFDRSTSVRDHELDHARELTRQRVAQLDHGDRIVALELLIQSIVDEPNRWSQQVPDRQFQNGESPRDSVIRTRFLRDVRDYISRFSNSEDRGHVDGTDILSTLHLVAAELEAFPDRPATLVIYSDMLQANRVMNMEGLARMPPPDWVRTQAERGTLPDLTDLCVVVVGARKDTRSSQIVRAFWEEYFEATGAIFLDRNYSYRPVRLPERPCAGP